jgi:hypothetical protein
MKNEIENMREKMKTEERKKEWGETPKINNMLNQKGGTTMNNNRNLELAGLEIQAIAMPNASLPDPYENCEWVAIFNDGFVYPYDPVAGKIDAQAYVDYDFSWSYAVELLRETPEAFFLYQ